MSEVDMKNLKRREAIESELTTLMQEYGKLVREAALAELPGEVEKDEDFHEHVWTTRWAFDELAEIIYAENTAVTAELEEKALDARCDRVLA